MNARSTLVAGLTIAGMLAAGSASADEIQQSGGASVEGIGMPDGMTLIITIDGERYDVGDVVGGRLSAGWAATLRQPRADVTPCHGYGAGAAGDGLAASVEGSVAWRSARDDVAPEPQRHAASTDPVALGVCISDPPPGEDPPGEDPPGEDPPGEDPPGEDPPGEDPPGEDPPPRERVRRHPPQSQRPPTAGSGRENAGGNRARGHDAKA